MKMLRCRTDSAILLVAVADAAGVLRFPSDFTSESMHGLHLAVQPLLPIGPQLVAVASRVLESDVSTSLDICQDFADEVFINGATQTTVFVGRVTRSDLIAPQGWLSFPDILRSMVRDRRRLPYLRAWQVLTGALSLNTKAVDVAEVAKHLLDSKTDA